ncbi:hypothetical protein K6U06_09800 [Acidiferrimicrobium sp. IK]|uniref:hypothetical protein n=1 Tax=Acidiferrimicrobium sp. IK TaxID=2871700 RepID=UPI0021CAF12E|nr:hypothetical protein [Acidiferrimicrobium sp. IK]MCU4184652.1 hypothetical protein [Acidiferrimicrobium sp. IK]
MRRLFRAAIRYGLRAGWSRGVLDGNRAWIAVGGVAVLGHLLGRVSGAEPDVVFSEKLAPGESFRITHLPRS